MAGIFTALLSGCTGGQDPLFERLDAEQTGVDFANTLVMNDSLMNPLSFFYVYNGGGVGAGDLNGNGRPDLYLAGNQVGNRLYVNQGNLQFRDVTDAAGVAARDSWSTGVTLVDVNQDGRMDLYVGVGGISETKAGRRNRLYVNQGTNAEGVPQFEERAEEYGIADPGYTTHAAFFDYDGDGALDLYVLNTSTRRRGWQGRVPGDSRGSLESDDRLYRNEGSATFTDVSEKAGLEERGHGLGLAVADLNKDGWPDIYVANDFLSTDRMYVNEGDGTFSNRSRQYLKHQSYSAMGVDVADVNSDAWSDIMVLDMLPQDPRRRRLISNEGVQHNGEWQYGRNTLQLNNGIGPNGAPSFSEIGQLANVEATGWSWAPLLADYDNDGHRDLFVTTGYGELVTHLDFIRRREQLRRSGRTPENRKKLFDALENLPTVDLPNRFFENTASDSTGRKGLQFTERTDAWAANRPGISNGAAFADLDRDGDLDLITNNINATATILENQANTRTDANALRVDLHGPQGNRAGIGAKVIVTNDGETQYHDHSPYRGFQSTVEDVVHFGLGADSTADSLNVVWPDSTSQLYTDVPTDSVFDTRYEEAVGDRSEAPSAFAPDSADRENAPLFRKETQQRGLDHRHDEKELVNLTKSPILPHKYSQNGPGVAIGDVNGDGRDDVFIGADQGSQRVLYVQAESGTFQRRALSSGTVYEDMGALFFDADGDGDQDLYVVSGSRVRIRNPEAYQDRLYLNDGSGTFRRASEALPELTASGSVVTAADYDEDGDLDLLVGGRVQPGRYPFPPRSYLLRNDSDDEKVQFTDVTEDIAPELAEVGLVTDARWTDFNGDDRVDLIVVGEWMPVTLFENRGDRFVEVTQEAGLGGTQGWWNSITTGDFDRDGDIDYAVGNFGLNTRYEASPSEPVRIHAKDFDGDGGIEPVLSRYIQGTAYPAHSRSELIDQILGMRSRFPSQRLYAGSSFDEVFTESEVEGAYVREAVRFETSYLENKGDGTFDVRSLPMRAQFAPVFGIQSGDYSGNGHLDLLMVGNWYAPDDETGRADASIGALFEGDGTGDFTYRSPGESGFFVDGDAKGLTELAVEDGASLLLATQNDGPVEAFRHRDPDRHSVRLQPLEHRARLTYEDGSVRTEELYYGSTYLSQSSRVLWMPPGVEKATIVRSTGDRRVVMPESSPVSEADR